MNGPRRPLRFAALVVGGACGVVLGLYVLAIVLVGSDVPKGTRVAGVDIGGMSRTAAQAKIAGSVPGTMPSKLSLAAADRTFDIVPAQSGLSIDAAATAKAAQGNTKSPAVALRALFGRDREVDPVVVADVGRLTAVLDEIGAMVRTEKVEGGLVFLDGVASAVEPTPGRLLDVGATIPAVQSAWRDGRVQVQGTMAVDEPAANSEAVARALADFGTKAMSAPVMVRVGETSVEVSAGQLGKYLTTTAQDGSLQPVLDGEGLAAELLESAPDLGTTARDAKFTFKNGKPKIVPSRAGTTIDPAKLGGSVLAVLTAPAPREVVAEVTVADPKFTTADAEALGITEKLSTFRTNYPYASYRVTNIGRAAKLINGSLVKPGDTWSLNKRVGQRTAANGFVKGFIIRGGEFAEDLGGGVSQSATTTFNAAFFAGLKDVEHHPHSLYIARYPAGREATVAWPAKDLRFENDSGHGVLIQAEHQVGSITVTFWGTKVWDKIESYSSPRRNIRAWKTVENPDPKCLAQLPAEGFDITVTRAFIKGGVEVKRESFNTVYAATDKILCTKDKPKPDPAASPSPSGSAEPSASPSPSEDGSESGSADASEEIPEPGGGGGGAGDVAPSIVGPAPSPAPPNDTPASTPPRSSGSAPGGAGRRRAPGRLE
ncbi:MAG: VanW family protein [Sporichthyaceae bacterium]